MLQGGDVLVVTLEVVPAAESPTADPTSIGEALLGLLGVGRPAAKTLDKPETLKRAAKQAKPEEDADAWLARTSRTSLKGMNNGS